MVSEVTALQNCAKGNAPVSMRASSVCDTEGMHAFVGVVGEEVPSRHAPKIRPHCITCL